MAFASRGDADGLRETIALTVMLAVTRQEKEWWPDS